MFMYNYLYSLLVLFLVIKNLNIYTLQDNPTWIQQKLNDQSHTIEQAENATSTSSSSSSSSSPSTLSSSLSLSMSTPEPLKCKLTSEKGTTKAQKLVSRSKNGHPQHYFSKYLLVINIPNSTSSAVIKELGMIFSEFGKPQVFRSDNEPCYLSQEFRFFMQNWAIEHRTSSPHYPQSNDLAESMVKVSKNLIEKAVLQDLPWN